MFKLFTPRLCLSILFVGIAASALLPGWRLNEAVAQVTCTPPGVPNTVNIAGKIMDEAGQPVPGVSIYLSDQVAISRADGTFSGGVTICSLSPPRCRTGFNSAFMPVSPNYFFTPGLGEFCPDSNVTFVAKPALFSNVSAASYRYTLAPGSIAALFSASTVVLSPRAEAATSTPLPEVLAGCAVSIFKPAFFLNTQERKAGLFFAARNQINYYIPDEFALLGPAFITVRTADGQTLNATALLTRVAPALFSANGNGQGVAAAVVLRVRADGSSQFEPVATLTPTATQYIPLPIDLGAPTDRLALVLFGTGFRGRSALDKVTATIGGLPAAVEFAGAQGGLVGVDQANVLLDRRLAGRGEVDVVLTVDGVVANTVKVAIK